MKARHDITQQRISLKIAKRIAETKIYNKIREKQIVINIGLKDRDPSGKKMQGVDRLENTI